MKKYIASVEVPDDWVPKHEPYSVDFFFEQDIMSTQMIEGDGWKSLDEIPKEGDETKSYKEYGLIVNGWQKLPKSREG